MRSIVATLIPAAAAAAVSALIVFDGSPAIGYPDSEGYLAVAEEFRRFDVQRNVAEIDPIRSMREPLYPLLLAFGGFIVPSGPAESALMIHFLLGFLALLTVASLWRGIPTRLAAIAGCGLVLARCAWAQAVMVEWCAVTLITAAAALGGHAVRPRSSIYPFAIAAGLFAILHPSLNALFLPAFGILIWTRWSTDRKPILGPAVAMISFIVIAAGFNFYRTSQFSPAPFGNIQRFGIAATIGAGPILESDEQAMQAFFRAVNTQRTSVDLDQVSPELLHRGPSELLHVYIVNTWEVGYRTAKALGLSVSTFNDYAGVYVRRVVAQASRTYARYVLAGLRGLIPSVGAMILLVLTSFFLVVRKRSPLLVPLMFLAGGHIVHGVICSSSLQYVDRLIDRTWIPLMAMAVAIVCAELVEIVSRTESLPADPGVGSMRFT